MAVFQSKPFETSFENLTAKAAKAGKKVMRAAGDTARAAAADVKQQLTGDYNKPLIEQMGLQTQSLQQQQQIQQDQQALLSQTRQNLERINAEMQRIREMRRRKEEERKKVAEQQEKQQKQAEEKKKQEDPIWKRMLRGKMGSREMSKNVAG